MILYFGSPIDLELNNTVSLSDISDLDDKLAIYLTKTFEHAALYAIGKTLFEKTTFAVSKNHLYIVGTVLPESGYVYSVEVDDLFNMEKDQMLYYGDIIPIDKKKVDHQDYMDKIIWFNDTDEFVDKLNLKPN